MVHSDAAQEATAQNAAIGQDFLWLGSLLPCELGQHGDALRGFSFCPKGNKWLMTVRVTLDGTPSVAFTCCGTPIACVASFKKRWDDETLEFFPDRYV